MGRVEIHRAGKADENAFSESFQRMLFREERLNYMLSSTLPDAPSSPGSGITTCDQTPHESKSGPNKRQTADCQRNRWP